MYRNKVSDASNCATIMTMLRCLPDIHVDSGDQWIINDLSKVGDILGNVHLFYLQLLNPKKDAYGDIVEEDPTNEGDIKGMRYESDIKRLKGSPIRGASSMIIPIDNKKSIKVSFEVTDE